MSVTVSLQITSTPTKEIDIIHLNIFSSLLICPFLVTATAHGVWLSSDWSHLVICWIFTSVVTSVVTSVFQLHKHYYCVLLSAIALDNMWFRCTVVSLN